MYPTFGLKNDSFIFEFNLKKSHLTLPKSKWRSASTNFYIQLFIKSANISTIHDI